LALISAYRGFSPRIDERAFLAESAVVTGDVVVGPEASVWYGAVLRGDVGRIRIGPRTNLQDLVVVHTTRNVSEALVGEEVTVGHRAIIHGATVSAGALIGMGSIILDQAEIGEEALVAAGTLVPPGMVVPAGVMVRGHPAKVIRPLTPEERARARQSAAHYVELGRAYGWGPRRE
jgi:carbonic anhydrase/acetyltransferase-like protein (isoleucine patch superfamily)